jgi:hypothetical protein
MNHVRPWKQLCRTRDRTLNWGYGSWRTGRTLSMDLRIKGQEHVAGSVGGLPQTRRRSVHDLRNLSRAPAASLRDRLRRPLTEPVCRQVRQLSDSGDGSGQNRVLSQRRRDLGDGDQDQPLTATVTATAVANRLQQRPATAHNSRTIGANWGYVRPEKQTVEDQRRAAATVAKTVAKPLDGAGRTWTTLEYRPSPRPVTDGPG